ncbi:hypothetical protein [Nocardiopsis sp. Huas11]|nr:hypothetical protein [Nocardiopsis sp. Huas11]
MLPRGVEEIVEFVEREGLGPAERETRLVGGGRPPPTTTRG